MSNKNINMKAKYIIINNRIGEIPIIFPLFFGHNDFNFNREKIISAGFVLINETGISCYGESDSLGIKSRGKEDGELIKSYFKERGF